MTQTTKTSWPGGQSGPAQENNSIRGTSTKDEVTAFGRLFKPPPYGSAEWEALPDCDPRKHEALVLAAESWRILASSPHLEVVLGEWAEWLSRKEFRDSAAAISALRERWVRLPTYAELDRRRNTYDRPPLTPAQIRAQADYSWRRLDREHRKEAA
jgi:hypothetical protein